jgi:signal transduction histidine kinase
MISMKILLLEDDEDDYILTRSLLGRIPGDFVLDWAASYDDAVRLLSSGNYDVCLVDCRLGDREGLELLHGPLVEQLPIIVLTGQDDPGVAMKAMKFGAADYLVKGEFNASMLERSMRYSIERKRIRDELVRARDGLDRLVLERTAELQQANDALVRREAELRQADSRKDEFLAMLAHELRNPLAAMKNALALARRSDAEEHRTWSLDILDRQTSRLVQMIDDLLDVSRITSGKIRLNRRVVEASAILDCAIEASRPMIEGRGHTLEIAIERGRLWLDVDPTRLEQVVQNLLSNAAKYTEENGRLWLKASNRLEEVVIEVRDAGIGIVPERLHEIFELFAQEDRSLERSQGGLGIGLTVVKKLVEMHGGSISAASEGIGQGSAFTIRLPAVQAPDSPTTGMSAFQQTANRTVRVLVVDDHTDSTRTLARLLELLGHDVRTAFDSTEATKTVHTHRPEVILLDIELPGLDGFQFASRIRENESARNTILVAISNQGHPDERRRSIEAGFNDHLVKPVNLDDLISILSQVS